MSEDIAPPLSADSVDRLLDVNAVADLCSCSVRHIRRLTDAGEFPSPVKLGRLVRWRRQDVRSWIADGGSAPRSRKGKVPTVRISRHPKSKALT